MMPGMAGMPGTTAGMVPGTTGMMTGMTGTTAMVPGMTGMGMTGATTGMTTGAMTPGMTGYQRTPGVMTPGVAAYPHVLSKMRAEDVLCTKALDKLSCEQHGCMWAGDACAEFTMQEEGEALSEKVLFYVVVPITLVCVTLALIIGARRCTQGTKGSDRPEALLLDDRKDHIVPVV